MKRGSNQDGVAKARKGVVWLNMQTTVFSGTMPHKTNKSHSVNEKNGIHNKNKWKALEIMLLILTIFFRPFSSH